MASSVSLPLNQFTPSQTPVNGNVTLSFPTPALDRVWQGSITIPGAPSTAIWELQINDQLVSVLQGNGPFGPLQVGSTQTISLVGSGAGSAALYGVLMGVNDPADNPTPFVGPSALPSPSAPSSVGITGQPIGVDITGQPIGITYPGGYPSNRYPVPPFFSTGLQSMEGTVGNNNLIVAAPSSGEWWISGWGVIANQGGSCSVALNINDVILDVLAGYSTSTEVALRASFSQPIPTNGANPISIYLSQAASLTSLQGFVIYAAGVYT